MKSVCLPGVLSVALGLAGFVQSASAQVQVQESNPVALDSGAAAVTSEVLRELATQERRAAFTNLGVQSANALALTALGVGVLASPPSAMPLGQTMGYLFVGSGALVGLITGLSMLTAWDEPALRRAWALGLGVSGSGTERFETLWKSRVATRRLFLGFEGGALLAGGVSMMVFAMYSGVSARETLPGGVQIGLTEAFLQAVAGVLLTSSGALLLASPSPVETAWKQYQVLRRLRPTQTRVHWPLPSVAWAPGQAWSVGLAGTF